MEFGLILSKFLGYVMIVGSSMMKVPQIITIIKGKTGEGISLIMMTVEVFLYAISFNYQYCSGFAISTYFEYFFLLVQDIIICLLIIYYAQQFTPKFYAVAGAFVVFFLSGFVGLIPIAALSFMQFLTTPLFIVAKMPQIIQSYKTKNTGALSLATQAGLLAGNCIRLFTTIKEMGGDLTMLSGYIVGCAINGIIVAQILIYGNKNGQAEEKKNDAEKPQEAEEKPKEE